MEPVKTMTMDYCISLLFGRLHKSHHKLWLVQDLVIHTKHASFSHWFKILLLTFKARLNLVLLFVRHPPFPSIFTTCCWEVAHSLVQATLRSLFSSVCILTVRAVVSRQRHCTVPGTDVCNTKHPYQIYSVWLLFNHLTEYCWKAASRLHYLLY